MSRPSLTLCLSYFVVVDRLYFQLNFSFVELIISVLDTSLSTSWYYFPDLTQKRFKERVKPGRHHSRTYLPAYLLSYTCLPFPLYGAREPFFLVSPTRVNHPPSCNVVLLEKSLYDWRCLSPLNRRWPKRLRLSVPGGSVFTTWYLGLLSTPSLHVRPTRNPLSPVKNDIECLLGWVLSTSWVPTHSRGPFFQSLSRPSKTPRYYKSVRWKESYNTRVKVHDVFLRLLYHLTLTSPTAQGSGGTTST